MRRRERSPSNVAQQGAYGTRENRPAGKYTRPRPDGLRRPESAQNDPPPPPPTPPPPPAEKPPPIPDVEAPPSAATAAAPP